MDSSVLLTPKGGNFASKNTSTCFAATLSRRFQKNQEFLMAMALNRFAQWLRPGSTARRGHEPPSNTALANAFPDFPSGFQEPDTVKFSNATAGGGRRRVRSRKVRNPRRRREEPRIDGEYDMVIVPSDGGGCLSGSESDGSDWSVGWHEPQAPELQSNGDSDDSFAVLVRCYRRDGLELPGRSKDRFLVPGNPADGHLSDGKYF